MRTVGANAKKQQAMLADCLQENSKINIAMYCHKLSVSSNLELIIS